MSFVDGRYRHGLRRLDARRVDEPGRAATPLELLFDLTFVAAFGVAANQLAHGIVVGHWESATFSFFVAMFAIVWAWINVSWFASAFDNDDWLYRLLTVVQMIGVIVLAIGLPPLFASIEGGEAVDNRLIVAGYVLMRLTLIVQWLRAVRTTARYRSVAFTYALFVGVAQVGWILMAALSPNVPIALVVVVVLFAVEVLGPIVAEQRGARAGGSTPWNPHHLAERFSLLTIIALGETVLGTLASATEISEAQGWTIEAVVVVGAGIVMSFALWWTYFLVPHLPVLEGHREKAVLWGYGHVLLYTAIAAVGAGLHLIGYLHDSQYGLSTSAVVSAIAVPVVVFMVARYFLLAYLISARPRGGVVELGAIVLPLIAIGAAMVGAPAWVCLLIVLASPCLIIVAFEIGGWRWLDSQLAAALGRAAPSTSERPAA